MGNDGGFNGILMGIECGNLKIQWDILSNNQNCSWLEFPRTKWRFIAGEIMGFVLLP